MAEQLAELNKGDYDSGWKTLTNNVFYRKVGNVGSVVLNTISVPAGGGVNTYELGYLPTGYAPSKDCIVKIQCLNYGASDCILGVASTGRVYVSGLVNYANPVTNIGGSITYLI